MIELMDDAIGTVLYKLDELDLEENTIICFTSDNGGVSSGDAYATSTSPLRWGQGPPVGRRNPRTLLPQKPRDHSARFNLCHSGQRNRLVPTLLDLCGIESPKEQAVDGVAGPLA